MLSLVDASLRLATMVSALTVPLSRIRRCVLTSCARSSYGKLVCTTIALATTATPLLALGWRVSFPSSQQPLSTTRLSDQSRQRASLPILSSVLAGANLIARAKGTYFAVRQTQILYFPQRKAPHGQEAKIPML